MLLSHPGTETRIDVKKGRRGGEGAEQRPFDAKHAELKLVSSLRLALIRIKRGKRVETGPNHVFFTTVLHARLIEYIAHVVWNMQYTTCPLSKIIDSRTISETSLFGVCIGIGYFICFSKIGPEHLLCI